MANSPALQSPTSNAANRDLAKLAMTTSAGEWNPANLARLFNPDEVIATSDELERSKQPLQQVERKLDGPLSAKVKAHLNTIGAAMRPDLSHDQAQSWVNAELIKLSNFPSHVIAKATERALHITFQYPSEVEGKVRAMAEEHMGRIAIAQRRLDALLAAINEAMKPQTPLLQSHDQPMSDQEVHDLQRSGQQDLVRLGLKLGYIKHDQLLPPDEPK